MTPDPPRFALGTGAAFILIDTLLIVAMQVIVKKAGATFPAAQLVFLRALVGLVLTVPLAWRHRAAIRSTRRLGDHFGRVLCNAASLGCNFAAIVALPLSLATAIGFTRPFVVLALAVVILHERVTPARWLAAIICFAGVLVMTKPGSAAWDWGLAAAFGSVLFGAMATIQIRRLAAESTVVLMLFYTLGLTILSAPAAALVWVAPRAADLPALLAIGILAQTGQFFYLRAYQMTEARILAPLAYLTIVLTVLADYLFFGLKPTPSLLLGAALIVLTTLVTHLRGGR